ncbi:MAG: sigma-70 family RNA polymerase sigma factor [Acidobacteriaceae bacterium]|nr:sigma-70 family RNA polymerase sigma factor [Acidobacteriaceae bacterium]
MNDREALTSALQEWHRGQVDAGRQVIEQVYSELHSSAAKMLRRERAGHTLQPTALVNELYLRLRAADMPQWRSRTHFFAVAANTLRRILIDHARARTAERRGGTAAALPLQFADAACSCSYEDLLSIEAALRILEQTQPRAARVTEMRFFAGMQESEIAEELGVSEITVKRDWKFARAWLAAHLSGNVANERAE